MSWPTVAIGSLVDRVSTWDPPKDAPEQRIEYVDLGAIDNQTKQIVDHQRLMAKDAPSRARQLIRAGDILVSTVRPNLNGVSRVPERLDGATASTGFCVLRPKAKLDGSYLFHWVRSPAFVETMVRRVSGQSYPAVSDRIVCGSVLPLPPPDEQRRIAAILDQADVLRRKRREALQRLTTLIDALFRTAFGDLKSAGARWPVVQFDEACADETSRSGKLQRGAYQTEGEHPVIDQGQSVVAGWSDDDKLLCRSELPVVVFGDHTRAVKYVDFDFIIGADGAKVLKPTDNFHPLFFALLLERMPLPDLGYSRHMREVKRLAFPAPPRELQDSFAKQIAAVRQEEQSQMRHAARLDTLFASLQHRAFRGELTTPSQPQQDDDPPMRDEYDLSNGVRGKFYRPGAELILPAHSKPA